MKDYANWSNVKIKIELDDSQKNFYEREIWWCSLGENVGSEEDGKHLSFERPVLVLKKFNKNMFFGIPLTSKKKDNPFHVSFNIVIRGENKKSFAKLSQMRLLSSKRIIRRIAVLNDNTFSKIKESFLSLFKNKTDPFGSSGA